MPYSVTLNAHCGMAVPHLDDADRLDARKEAARVLRDARRTRHAVSVLKRGRKWEITEPPDAVMVPDTAGVLAIRFTDPFAHLPDCPECGCRDFTEDGRGNVYCSCQTCPGCGEPDGHYPGCPEVEEDPEPEDDYSGN